MQFGAAVNGGESDGRKNWATLSLPSIFSGGGERGIERLTQHGQRAYKLVQKCTANEFADMPDELAAVVD